MMGLTWDIFYHYGMVAFTKCIRWMFSICKLIERGKNSKHCCHLWLKEVLRCYCGRKIYVVKQDFQEECILGNSRKIMIWDR